jgi:hypothetical protein
MEGLLQVDAISTDHIDYLPFYAPDEVVWMNL